MTDSLLEGISAFVESKTGAEMMEETKEIR